MDELKLDATEGLFGLGDQVQALRRDVMSLQFAVLVVGIVVAAHALNKAGVNRA